MNASVLSVSLIRLARRLAMILPKIYHGKALLVALYVHPILKEYALKSPRARANTG
jgi:hypothetical protein